ncbi:MAG: hypothetical protein K2N72_13510 [Oscillospiraceae bacterium]|nr:hypothetical protein [Oscillospiraceae bacterium]
MMIVCNLTVGVKSPVEKGLPCRALVLLRFGKTPDALNDIKSGGFRINVRG